jgi:hypothetical protein
MGRRSNVSEDEAEGPPINILVSVDEQYRKELNNITQELKSAGMTVAEVFSGSGVIAGAAAGGVLGKLRSVQGVASVEEEPTFEAQNPADI